MSSVFGQVIVVGKDGAADLAGKAALHLLAGGVLAGLPSPRETLDPGYRPSGI